MKPSPLAQRLSRRMKSILWTDATLALLPGYGWNDGGCAILALALLKYFGVGQLVGVWSGRDWPLSGSVLEHVVLKVGNVYLDGEGVSTEAALLERWRVKERVKNLHLEVMKRPQLIRVAEVEDIPIEPALIRKVALFLGQNIPAEMVLGLAQEKGGLA
jgi:hypothetical protein